MRAIRTFFGLALVGAIGTPLVAFIVQAAGRILAGIPRDQVSLGQLLQVEMELPAYAVMGAAGGAALAVAVLLTGAVVDGLRSARRRRMSRPRSDPDAIIRSQRAAQADEYLAGRRREEGRGAASGSRG